MKAVICHSGKVYQLDLEKMGIHFDPENPDDRRLIRDLTQELLFRLKLFGKSSFTDEKIKDFVLEVFGDISQGVKLQ